MPSRIWILIVLLWLLPAPARGAGGSLSLIFAADLDGHFTPRRCAGPDMPGGPGLPALAGAIRLSQDPTYGGAALVIGGPALLGPGDVARFLLGSPSGGRHAARLLRKAGIEVLVPGVQEFAAPAAGLLAFADELANSGPAPLLSNVTCPARSVLCRYVVPQLVLSRHGVRVGLLGLVSADLGRRVAPGNLHGAEISPPAQVVAAAQRLRAQADVLVLIGDLGNSQHLGLQQAIELARALDAAGAHADVVLLGRLDDPHGGVTQLSLSSGTLLVGAPAAGAGVTVVTVTLPDREDRGDGGGRGRAGGAVQIAARRVLSGAPDVALGREVERVHEQACQRWGRPVTGPLPPGGLGRAVFARVVLDALRELARAEVAVLNSGAIAARGLPVLSPSAAAIGSALPFPARVVRAAVTGKVLADALLPHLQAAPENDRLLHAGLSLKGGALQVNGRPVDPAATYTVATIDFVAAGGDGLVPAGALSGGVTVVPDLRLAVLEHLRRRGLQALAPLTLAARPLWSASWDVGLDLQSTSINNPGGVYDRPQLGRSPALSFRADTTLRLQMDQPMHLLQGSLRMQYGQSRTAPAASGGSAAAGPPAQWQETVDLINFLSLYTYRGLTRSVPWAPTPYASLGLESEFNAPAGRGYLHLELSPVGGLRMAITPKLSLQLGLGVRRELLARTYLASESGPARARFLLTTTLELQKTALVPRLGTALLGELLLTYAFTDPDRLRTHELRTTGKLYVALGRPLYLTAGVDLYLYGDRGRDPGVALDVTAGIKVLLDRRQQVF